MICKILGYQHGLDYRATGGTINGSVVFRRPQGVSYKTPPPITTQRPIFIFVLMLSCLITKGGKRATTKSIKALYAAWMSPNTALYAKSH